MEIQQAQFDVTPEPSRLAALAALQPHLVFVFGSVERMSDPALTACLNLCFPDAQQVGCSTAGEISDSGVADATLVITAIRFKVPSFRVAGIAYDGTADSNDAGQRLAHALAGDDLRSILILGQGVDINGSALVAGVAGAAGAHVTLTGGLAGDGGRFSRTWTLCNGLVSDRHVIGIGFYGDAIRLSCGAFGGWQPFGSIRQVTRAQANVLFELDGEPALEIYRRYLGDYARDLPGSALLFPFAMIDKDHGETGLIRTILGVDEAAGSLTLAGDIVEGGFLQLMTASTDALVDGAEAAATAMQQQRVGDESYLALLVSCVGRKLVMGGRVEEEVEAIKAVFGAHAVTAGFYSNGEISPSAGYVQCQLHNESMAITCLRD
jgi:hypothetical protein